MTNSFKILIALGLLAGFSACGSDDNSPSNPVDAGGPSVIKPVDSGIPSNTTPDAGPAMTTTTGDGGTTAVTPGADGGMTMSGDCFSGTPVQMVDFLNRCTTSQTTTKTLAVPANLLNNGMVLPL